MFKKPTYKELEQRIKAFENSESEHKQTEEKFRAIFDNAPFAYQSLNEDGKFKDINPTWLSTLGYTRNEIIGKFYKNFLHPDWQTYFAKNFQKFKNRGYVKDAQFKIRHKDGHYLDVAFEGCIGYNPDGSFKQSYCVFHDITNLKKAQEALRQSEATVRNKLKAITQPTGDIASLELSDIIDAKILQSIMDDFYQLTGMLGAVLDISGKILVAVGWQDICTKFHRCHPATLKNCIESDTILTNNVAAGTFKAYRCKNNMCEMVTPLIIGDRHLGNVFIGQFFYDDEVPDVEIFRQQARKYGFDEDEYLAALDRVPHFSKETVDHCMQFYSKLAKIISALSFSTIQQSRLLANQKQTQKAMEKNQLLLAEAQRAAKIGGFDFDLKTNLQNWTEETFRIMEVDIIGGAPDVPEGLSFIAPDYRKMAEKAIQRAMEDGEPYQQEWEIITAKGNSKWVQSIGKAHKENGIIKSIYGSLQDITERKQAEQEHERLRDQLQQAQKMESVGKLAGGVAHDYNNISSIIIGYAELALDKLEARDPLYADLMEILTAAKRSSNITQQLLAFARKQNVTPKVLDLNDTIGDLLKMLQRLIGEDINLVWIPGAKLRPLKIDPSQINQIMANLCLNARDAIDNVGRITVETKNINFDQAYCANYAGFVPGEYIMLSISDDGCGMTPEMRDKIFEPFFTTKDISTGPGLGLSTVYGIVKQNNGFVNVYSEMKQGTTFRIYLPIYLGPTGKVDSPDNLELPLSRGETVLLVEDEDSILKIVKRVLEKLGYIVLFASSPVEAIRLADEHADKINLLITDVVMPEMNGRELAERLQSLYPNLKSLFMSGYTADSIAKRGILESGVSFIAKPFSSKALALKVREVLDQVKS